MGVLLSSSPRGERSEVSRRDLTAEVEHIVIELVFAKEMCLRDEVSPPGK